MTDASAIQQPVLRVLQGHPTAEELAAVVALAAAGPGPARDGAGPESSPQRRRGAWNDPAHQHVHLPWPGPGAWATSLR